MAKKQIITTDDAINFFKLRGYEWLDEREYNNTSIKYKCKCIKTGLVQYQSVGNIKNKHRCKICGRIDIIQKQRLSYEIVYIKSNLLGWRLLTFKKDYISAAKNMLFLCPNKKHEYMKSYYEILNGKGCQYCSGTYKKQFKEVKEEFENIKWKILTKKK